MALKVSKKYANESTISTIQELINKDLNERIKIKDFIIDNKIKLIKNTVNVICKQCGSDQIYVESHQIRSGDEAATKFYTCLSCGNKWRVD